MSSPIVQEVKITSSGFPTLISQLETVEKRLTSINSSANNPNGLRNVLKELQAQHHTLKAMAADLKTSADKLVSIDQRASTVLQNATRQAQAFSAATSTMNVRLSEANTNLTKMQSAGVRWTSDMGRATSGLTRVADTTQKAAAAAQRSAAEHSKVANHTRNVNQHLQSTLSLSNNLHGVWRGMSASAGMIWLSWGNTLGMIAGLVPSIAALKSISANRELGWQMALVGAAAEEGDARVKALTRTLLDMGGGQYTQGPLQMAEALRVLAQAGLKTQEAMSLLPSVLNMALVAGTTDEQAALFTTGLRSAFNLYDPASLKAGMDQTAMAANVSQTSIEQMMMSMKQASAAANKFGLSVADTSTTLALLARVNITGSSAGTAVRNLLTDLAGRTEKSRKALEALGISAYDASGMVKPFTQIIAELQEKFRGMDDKSKQLWMRSFLDERGMRAADVLLNTTTEEFRKLHQEILRGAENMGYTTVQAGRLGDTAEGSFRKMKAAWESTFAVVGGQTEGPYKGVLDSLTNLANRSDVVNGLTGIANGLIGIAKAGVGVLSVLSPLTPLLVSLGASTTTVVALKGAGSLWTWSKAALAATEAGGKYTRSLSLISTLTSSTTPRITALTVAARSMWAAFASNPLGWAVAGAAALAGVYTYMKMSADKANEFAVAVKGLRSDLAAVSTETYKAFNTSGAGHRMDVKLGIDSETGKHFDTEYQALLSGVQNKTALSYQQTTEAFAQNLARINQVTQDEITKLSASTEQTLAQTGQKRIEQELMIRDRKQTLLMDQLTNLDKMLASQKTLSEKDRNLRMALEKDVYDNAIKLMNLRTQYAVQKLREIRAEAIATASFFDRLTDPNKRLDPGVQAQMEDAERAWKAGTATPQQRAFYERRQELMMSGVSPEQAGKQAGQEKFGLSVAPAAVLDAPAFFEMLQRNGKTPESWALEDPEKRLSTMTALQHSIVQDYNNRLAEVSRLQRQGATTNTNQTNRFGTTRPQNNELVVKQAELERARRDMQTLLPQLVQGITAVHRQKGSEVRAGTARSQVEVTGNEFGTPPTSSRSGGAKREPTFSSSSYISLRKQQAQRDLREANAELELEYRRYGMIDPNGAAARRSMNAARRIDELNGQGDAEKIRTIRRDARVLIQSGKGSAEDRAAASDTLRDTQSNPAASSRMVPTYTKLFDHVPRITSGFGPRKAPVPGASTFHNGIDLAVPEGTPIHAPAGGRVRASYSTAHGGIQLLFDDDNGVTHGMAHLSQVLAKVGDRIEAGQVLAKSGRTGIGTGPHLHYTTRVNGRLMDPTKVMTSPGGRAVPTLLGVSGESGESSAVQAQQLRLQRYNEDSIKYRAGLEQEELNFAKQRLDMEIQLGVYSEERSRQLRTQLEITQLEKEKRAELQKLEARGVTDDPNNDQDLYSVTARRYDEKISLVKEQMENQIRLQRDWRMGLQRSYNEIVANSFNYAKFASSQMDSVVGHMTSAMENLAITGRFRFREMTVSILQDLSKIYMRMATMKLVNYVGSYLFGGSGVSTAGGSVGGMFATAAHGRVFNSSGLVAFARGGVVSSPTYFGFNGGHGLMGEQGSEAVMPLTRTANGNLGVQVQGMGGGTVVNAPVSVSVTVNSDGSTESGVNANEAKQLGEAIRNTVVEQVTRMLRPGEIINNAIRNGGVA